MAQQAAEKAIKAVFIAIAEPFPYTHDLRELIDLLHSKLPLPDPVREAHNLTPYAFKLRYPAHSQPTTEAQYRKAVATAETVLHWAEETIPRLRPDLA